MMKDLSDQELCNRANALNRELRAIDRELASRGWRAAYKPDDSVEFKREEVLACV